MEYYCEIEMTFFLQRRQLSRYVGCSDVGFEVHSVHITHVKVMLSVVCRIDLPLVGAAQGFVINALDMVLCLSVVFRSGSDPSSLSPTFVKNLPTKTG